MSDALRIMIELKKILKKLKVKEADKILDELDKVLDELDIN